MNDVILCKLPRAVFVACILFYLEAILFCSYCKELRGFSFQIAMLRTVAVARDTLI